ncbi:hypothetical protein VRRI112168_10325 [Vreelandella rituensis]|uniref:hypothetical protein n=1 Tax=Vreelandella rituensis TaxID=2282306 RepID=UPI0015F121BD|nr:hypothetical protein [Halomonas rituensis]
MAMRIWIPTVAALALLLSACGDNETTEPAQEQDSAPSAVEQAPDSEEAPAEPEPSTMDEQAGAVQPDESAPEQASPATAEDIDAGDETLEADAAPDVLGEENALPGEATRSDVDDMIAETERRFEEAQRQLEEQFEQAESEEPVLESMESSGDLTQEWETESQLPEDIGITQEPGTTQELESFDVDEMIEDTERRFEEAQRQLEEQYEEIEQGREMESLEPMEPMQQDDTGETAQ